MFSESTEITITADPEDGVVCLGGNLSINCSTSTPGVTAAPCLVIDEDTCEYDYDRIKELSVDNPQEMSFMLANVSMDDNGQIIRCHSQATEEYSEHSVTVKAVG